jgi:hypothetical protein
MARTPTLSIADLERVIATRRAEINKLVRQRSELQKKINGLDRKIERLGGGSVNGSRRGGRVSAGGRVLNEHSLNDTIETVLRGNGKPMKVAEIMDGVLATGYRSSSENFRGIINQTLIKDKRFGQASRGVYELKAGGKKAKE